MLVEVKNLEARIIEHLQILKPPQRSLGTDQHTWKAPPLHSIKFNIDAAITHTGAIIAAVARYSDGAIFQCWMKHLPTADPCIAETTALVWALELARAVNLSDILIESDAKISVDAFHGVADYIPWKIQSLISNARTLALKFSSVSLNWVCREANGVAHSLAKFATSQPKFLLCNSSNLPPSVREAWLRDLSSLFS